MLRNIVVVDQVAQPEGWTYYNQTGTIVEPLGNGQCMRFTAKDVYPVNGTMNLYSLLYGIFQQLEGTGDQANVLIVCHANTEELLIKVTDKENSPDLTPMALQQLTYWGELLGDKRLRASAIGITVDELDDILDYAAIIREDKLVKHFAIRACRLGQNTEVLNQFTQLLGCESISVPLQKDAYAAFFHKSSFTPDEIDASIALVDKTLGDGATQIYERREGLRKERLIWYMTRLEHSRFKVTCVSQSLEIYQDFLREVVLVPEMLRPITTGVPVPFHALSDGIRQLIFQPDPRFSANLKYFNPSQPFSGPPLTEEAKKSLRERIRNRWQNRPKLLGRLFKH